MVEISCSDHLRCHLIKFSRQILVNVFSNYSDGLQPRDKRKLGGTGLSSCQLLQLLEHSGVAAGSTSACTRTYTCTCTAPCACCCCCGCKHCDATWLGQQLWVQ